MERFVCLRDMRLPQQMTEDAFARAGQARRISVMVDSTPLMVAFVAGGLGLAITHSMSALVLPAGVVAVPFRPRIAFGYAALTRSTDAAPPILRAFIALARAAAREALDRLKASPARR